MMTSASARRWIMSSIYGPSYFGSGGGSGSVRCCHNCRETGDKDNGFCSGPETVEVIDTALPALFAASGGDCVGEGRTWREAAWWSVLGQEWVPLTTGFPCGDREAVASVRVMLSAGTYPVDTHEDAQRRAFERIPPESDVRLVYADWLDDRGESELASEQRRAVAHRQERERADARWAAAYAPAIALVARLGGRWDREGSFSLDGLQCSLPSEEANTELCRAAAKLGFRVQRARSVVVNGHRYSVRLDG